MSQYIHKSHNVSLLLYHVVCPCKYRRAVITTEVDQVLKEVCLEIAIRYEIVFIEIGTDLDHVHFLVQCVPDMSPTQIARTIKSITGREVFARVPSIKKQLWGGAFWSSGFFVNTVSRHGTENTIRNYVAKQGRKDEYTKLHTQQLTLF